MKNRLFSKLFLTSSYFTIALKKRGRNVLSEGFSARSVFPAVREHWCADPMLAEEGENTYLFYEAVTAGHGRIEVVQVFDDCAVSAPTVLLEDECHYSYPFVFRKDGTWYMIPESSAAGEVRLYRASEFPYHWEMQQVLLRERAVDTTVFETNGSWFLLTFLTDGKDERVTPRVFQMCFSDEKVRLNPLGWEAYNSLRVRGAGPLFAEGERLLRPAQVSTEVRYGDAVVFYQAAVSGDTYKETQAGLLTPAQVRADRRFFDGLHTYTASEHFEAIDLRVHDFDLLKLPRRMIGVFRR